MRFILHEIHIWFSKDQEPQILYLKPNKVNVITGDSGSGKTNILAIIDYCFLSLKINIVEEIINENAQWYSLKFTINDSECFLGRRKLNLDMEHSDVCFVENIDISKYPTYPAANISSDDARRRLDELFNITDKERYPFKKVNGVYPLQISYRSFLLYNYLTERIITLDNIFLDFDYLEETLFGENKAYVVSKALGFDDSKRLKTQEELDIIKKAKDSFDKKQKNNRKSNDDFIKKLDIFLMQLHKHKIISDPQEYSDPQDTIDVIQNIITQFEKRAIATENNEDLSRLKKEYNYLYLQYKNILKSERDIEEYNAHIESYRDSLMPIEVLKLKKEEIARSYETQQLINALELSLKQIKNADTKKVSQTLVSPIEKERLKAQLKELDNKIKKYSLPDDTSERSPLQYMFVANLQRDLSHLLKKQSGLLQVEDSYMPNYVERCFELQQIISNEEGSKPALEYAINQSIQSFYDQLNFMGNYTGNDTLFDWDKYLLQLRKSGKKRPHGNIGSKSNYMFLHLSLFLGLHKHFNTLSDNRVLPFLFIDQPSIPYYAGSENVNNNDKDKLIDAFTLLNNFITIMNQEMATDFQILLIEHAPPSYWVEANLENFHLVEEFTKGNKLIPQRIIDSNKQ